MASSGEKCSFCHNDMNVPQKGWRLKDSSYAKLCVVCASAYRDGTFCYQYHNAEDGWRLCDECERQLHCGCIMALHTFELNDTCGVTCKECLGKKSVEVSNVGASSSASCLNKLDDSCGFQDNVTEELLVDPSRSKPLNDDKQEPDNSKPLNDGMQEPDKATLEGDLEQSQLPKSDIIFLFGKKLTPSDCDLRIGRLLLPTPHAEKLVPLLPGQCEMPVAIKDTRGTFWNFKFRWWPNRNSRKYVLDGARQCCQGMQWNVGDILKFYRQLSDGKLIMELQKDCESRSSVIPLVADASRVCAE